MVRDVQDPERLEEMIEELGGVRVTYGGDSTWGLFGATDEVLFEALQVVGADELVRVPTRAVPALEDASSGDPITVDGRGYKIREPPRRNGDGAMLRVWLKEA